MTAVVCIALTDADGALLCCQRPPGGRLAGLWELPGGKVEAGEEPETALRRELGEELSLELSGIRLMPMRPAVHTYPFGAVKLLPFHAAVSFRPPLVLHEHTEARWLLPQAWESVEWAPADLPVLDQLSRL